MPRIENKGVRRADSGFCNASQSTVTWKKRIPIFQRNPEDTKEVSLPAVFFRNVFQRLFKTLAKQGYA